MSKEPELKARDKVVVRMTREGAVEENLTAGTEQRVSKRLEDAELVKPAETAEPSEALSAEEQKKAQMMCCFNTSSRERLIDDMKSITLNDMDGEIAELMYKTIRKLEAMTDAEFEKLYIMPDDMMDD